MAAILAVLLLMVIGWLETRDHSVRVPAPLEIPATTSFDPPIRVNLTAAPVKRVKLTIEGAYTIQPVGSTRVLHRGGKLADTDVTLTATGFRVGGREYPVARLEIVPESGPAIWIDDHQYRGSMRLHRQPGRRFIAVNVLPLEQYVASVVDSEMPAAFPAAARQAQAIVARTYALAQTQAAAPGAAFELYASQRSQKYLGYQYRDANGRRLAGETAEGRRIAQNTAGMVCVSQGKLFTTYYSAVCGGRTTLGTEIFADAAPPLQSVACDWCREAKLYRWTGEISLSDAGRALKPLFTARSRPFERLETIEQVVGDETGRISTFRVSDGRHRYSVSGVELREHWPGGTLSSPRFRITRQGDRLAISGRGHGHGVGLCQWGARGQALAGRGAVEIVQHYYPGARVVMLRGSEAQAGASENRQ